MLRIRGAGPAGLMAALTACHADEVYLYEKGKVPGYRFHGGFQVVDNYSLGDNLLPFLESQGISPPPFWVPLHHATFFDENGNAYSIFSSQPYGFLIKRGPTADSLDSHFCQLAKERGVKLCFQATTSQADIDATGPKEVDGIAMEEVFATDARPRIWVLLDQTITPGGYAYCFTYDGWGTMGAAVTRGMKHLRSAFQKSKERFFQIEKFPFQSKAYASRFMNFFLPELYEHQGCRYAGEAGGIQDFLFGLGIRYALYSGFLAGQKNHYSMEIRKTFHRRFLVGILNRFFYEKLHHFTRFFLRRAVRQDFQPFLSRIIKGSLPFLIFTPLIQKHWERHEPCRHFPQPHWCRRH